MQKSKIPYAAIEREIAQCGNVEFNEVHEDRPAALFKLPVSRGDAKGHDYIPVEDVPESIEDLPFLDERRRLFSYRYAMESKPKVYWAQEFGISPITVNTWMHDPAVKAHIAFCRANELKRTSLYRDILNHKIHEVIRKILDLELDGENLKEVVSIIKFLYPMLNPSLNQRAPLHLNVGVNTIQSDNKIADYTPEQLEEIQRDMTELTMIAEDYGILKKDE